MEASPLQNIGPDASQSPQSALMPASAEKPARRSFLHNFLLALFLVVGLIALAIGWATWRTGSLRLGLASLAGHDLTADPGAMAISGRNGEAKSLTIHNLSGKPINIVGYNAQCSCVKIAGLPVMVDSHQNKVLEIRAVSNVARDVNVVFLTDDPGESNLSVDIKVRAE